MKQICFLLLFICGNSYLYAQQNYKHYHLNINKAEEQAFVQNDIKAALQTYQNIFNQYDFVFSHDCMTAIELALFDSNAIALLSFADKGTQNGLLPRHFNSIPYIKKHPLYIQYTDSIVSLYKRNRPKYLARIDTAALQKMYSLFAYDQMEKNPYKSEGIGPETGRRYKPMIEKTWQELKQLIYEKGWPSDKLIGIGQKDIMKELKTGTADMIDLYRKYKEGYNYSISEGQFTIDEWELHSTFFFAVMVHYGGYYGFNFFPDEFYIEQIEKGNLHPQDIAMILDFKIDWNKDPETTLKMRQTQRYFGAALAHRPTPITEETYKVPLDKINKARALFYIKPVETEIAKDNFRHNNRIYMGWGYGACRF